MMMKPMIMTGIVSLLLILTGCTKSPQNPSSGTAIPSGRLLFDFDYRAVDEVFISKSDPASGDHWALRLTNGSRIRPLSSESSAPNSTISSDAPDWEIQPALDAQGFIDRKAHGSLIEHLLDTLRTFQIIGMAPKGPVESFGLKPPVFQISWKAGNAEFEFRIGSKAHTGAAEQAVYCQLIKQGPGKGSEQVLIGQGAAVKMLELLNDSNALRLPTLLAISSDAVDEIERENGFYAQREGDQWRDRKHRKLNTDIGSDLEQLTHLRIQQFIDDPAKNDQALQVLKRHSFTLKLKDRHGNTTQLALAKAGGQILGAVSSRPEARPQARRQAAFVVYPKAIEIVQSFK